MTKSEKSGLTGCEMSRSKKSLCKMFGCETFGSEKTGSEHSDPNRPGRVSWMCPKRPGAKCEGSKRPVVNRTGPKRPGARHPSSRCERSGP